MISNILTCMLLLIAIWYFFALMGSFFSTGCQNTKLTTKNLQTTTSHNGQSMLQHHSQSVGFMPSVSKNIRSSSPLSSGIYYYYILFIFCFKISVHFVHFFSLIFSFFFTVITYYQLYHSVIQFYLSSLICYSDF